MEWIIHLITNAYKKVKPKVNLQIAAGGPILLYSVHKKNFTLLNLNYL